MRVATRFRGFAGLDRHHRVGIVLAGVCMVAMAVGVTPSWSVGQMLGAAMAVLAFGSIIAMATAPRDDRDISAVAGRITESEASDRRAA